MYLLYALPLVWLSDWLTGDMVTNDDKPGLLWLLYRLGETLFFVRDELRLGLL
jgi:hypothetical protein